MKPRQVAGIALELAGIAAIMFAVWGLIDIGSCGGDDAPPCPPEATPYFLALMGGIVGTVVASFVSRRAIGAMFLSLPGFGVMLLVKATVDREPGERTALAAVSSILLLLSLAAAGGLWRTFRKQQRAIDLMQHGRKARGRIVGIHDTGVTINDDPRVRITFSIEPLDGTEPWEGTKTLTVPRVRPPRQDEVWPVWYDPARARDQWAVGMPSGTEAVPNEVWEEFGITPPGTTGAEPRLDALERLGRLRDQGVLTDDEFAREKARVLGEAADG